jgi:hypothetical protein
MLVGRAPWTSDEPLPGSASRDRPPSVEVSRVEVSRLMAVEQVVSARSASEDEAAGPSAGRLTGRLPPGHRPPRGPQRRHRTTDGSGHRVPDPPPPRPVGEAVIGSARRASVPRTHVMTRCVARTLPSTIPDRRRARAGTVHGGRWLRRARTVVVAGHALEQARQGDQVRVVARRGPMTGPGPVQPRDVNHQRVADLAQPRMGAVGRAPTRREPQGVACAPTEAVTSAVAPAATGWS